jgi:acetyl esterase/lipase
LHNPVRYPKRINPKLNPSSGGSPLFPELDVSFVKRKFLDLAYASISPAQKLDLFLPEEGEGPFPVLVQIHGGGFEKGDKRDEHLLPFLNGINHGLAVATLNYRMSGEAKFPAAVQDVKAAIRWLRANQEKYYLDDSRIAACGGSAGANLAAMLGTIGQTREFDNPALGNVKFSSAVQAVVAWFGPMDFLAMDDQLAANGFGPGDHSGKNSPEARYLGAGVRSAPGLAKKANPATYAHPDIPPFLIQHGIDDRLVPYQQSVVFAQQLVSASRKERVTLELIKGAGHGDPRFETKENMERTFKFILAALN